MSEHNPRVVNVNEVEEEEWFQGEHWGHAFKALTPDNLTQGGLGVSRNRLPPGHAATPFHAHQREDEAFYVLSGRGVLRYGGHLREIRPGDCISCPAGTGIAHQIANPFDEDLVYLAIGPHDPHEVCTYPDSGKVMVRSLGCIGHFEKTAYMDGEPERPQVFDLMDNAVASKS